MRARALVAAAILFASIGCRGCSCGDQITSLDALASLGDSSGDVRRRPAGVSAWNGLSLGEDLFSGDWVQTGASASARLDFKSGSKLSMGPSSTVVIDDPSSRQRLSVKAGTIEGSLLADAQILVSTPDGAEVKLSSKGQTQYRVSVGSEGKVELAVTQGALEVTAADGKTARIEPGQASEIKGGRLVGELRIVPLPPPPAEPAPPPPPDRLLSPAADTVIKVAAGSPLVEFAWQQATPGAKVKLRVSRSPDLSAPVAEEESDKGKLRLRNLEPGVYYWGAFEMVDGVERPLFAQARKIEIKRESGELRVPSQIKWGEKRR